MSDQPERLSKIIDRYLALCDGIQRETPGEAAERRALRDHLEALESAERTPPNMIRENAPV